jgi:outer membrane receptor for Fe3+-dicitrate
MINLQLMVLHDFGQDFIQTIQQIEVYKGASGAHFGPSAVAGAINFITDIDYTNSYSVSGFNLRNNSAYGNYTKITDNGWHLNIKGTAHKVKLTVQLQKEMKMMTAKNYQINLNAMQNGSMII